jgi:divalent metal cation (Fe/Co/Zn/Cd) transporter
VTSTDRTRLTRLGLRLEWATIVWNVGEAALTIVLGIAAASLALIGFGSDSIIEVFASSVVVWHLAPGHEVDHPVRTARALRLVGIAFALLAVILLGFSLRDLLTQRVPEESVWGIVYLGLTAFVMLGLAVAKRRVADRLDSAPLRSEASMTYLDAALAAGTMLGLLLNATLEWWWADPAAALLVAFAAANEAKENWEEASQYAEPDP